MKITPLLPTRLKVQLTHAGALGMLSVEEVYCILQCMEFHVDSVDSMPTALVAAFQGLMSEAPTPERSEVSAIK